MLLRIFRTYEKEYTKGRLVTPFGEFFTIERPDLGNQKRISCIPEGTYHVTKSYFYGGKNKGKRAFRLHNVPNRNGILIHVGNFVNDVVGCIAPGMAFSDEFQRTYSSANAFNELWQNLPEDFQLKIQQEPNKYASVLRWKENTYQVSESEPVKPLTNGKKTKRNLTILAFVAFFLKLFKIV